MKIIQHTQLRLTDEKSDKIYEVDLCEQPQKSEDERFLVNFRYGRFGKKMREGTKTTDPVTHEKAIKLFDSLVVSKVNKGYQDTSLQSNSSTDTENSLDNDSDFIPLATTSAQNTIVNYLHNPPKNWKLSRIVWRAGDFDMPEVEVGDRIVEIVNSAKKLTKDKEEAFFLRYSCLWALASCGEAKHLPAIQALTGGTKITTLNSSVQLMLAEGNDKQHVANELLTQLPKQMAESIRTNNVSLLLADVTESAKQRKVQKAQNWWRSDEITFPKESIATILTVYQLSYIFPMCKQAIWELIDTELETIHFDLVKKLFKFSQLYRDGKTFAKSLALMKKMMPTWETSCSKSDIDYHRRRSWRALRKLAEANNNMAYVEFAEAILLTVKDSDAKEPRTVTDSRYDWQNGGYTNTTKHYGRFPKSFAFNHILFSNSEHIQKDHGLSWTVNKEAVDTGRTEAFSEFWDTVPERLLNLLLQGQCEEVHTFATKALRDNSDFCASLADERVATLEQLLVSQYETTAQFALELAKTAYEKSASLSLLTACLQSPYQLAKEQAIQWLQDNPDLLKTDYTLFALALLNSLENAVLVDCFAKVSLSTDEANELLNAVITDIKQRESLTSEQIKHIVAHLLQLIPQSVQNLPIHRIDELFNQEKYPQIHCQLFGALLLLENSIAIADIPTKLLAKINQSDSEQVQSTAISLLKKLTDEELLAKYDALFGFVVSPKKLMREAVQPVLERLADNDEFTSRLLADLVPFCFRSEPIEGFHDDVLTLCDTTLAKAVAGMNTKLRWRLLNAQSKTAKKLGAMHIEHVSADSYSVKQWALLGANEMLSVRQYVWHIYSDNIALIQANLNDALRLLNNKWDDSRSFALSHFREQLADDDWTANLIVCICDNTFDDVQLLGRELLTRCFKEGDGEQYLMQLSQHPTQNVQLFTTNFLEDYAGDDLAKLTKLKPYFITILSQVFKGRVAKNRVIKFLNKQALNDEMVARLVSEIYTRQSVTMAVIDKAQYIEGMQELRAKYPSLKLPIQVRELALKGKSRQGKSVLLQQM